MPQVNALPSPEVSLYVADAYCKGARRVLRYYEYCFVLTPEIVPSLQEVMGARARFPKPTDVYELLATFGTNILVTEGEEWKRQRKIAAPAFSEVCAHLCYAHPPCDGRHLVLTPVVEEQ